MNQFADLTKEEFREKINFRSNQNRTIFQSSSLLRTNRTLKNSHILDSNSFFDLPDNIDWTNKGMVTPVQDQGEYGLAVAFASVAAIESAHAINKGKQSLVRLSVQQIQDCCNNNEGSTMTDDDVYKVSFSLSKILAYKY